MGANTMGAKGSSTGVLAWSAHSQIHRACVCLHSKPRADNITNPLERLQGKSLRAMKPTLRMARLVAAW